MSKVALKLVEAPSHHERQIQLWPRDQDEQGHSLHYLVSYPNNFPWSLPNYFIQKYTQKGELILDPFCSTGATVLEAALMGRVGLGFEVDPVAVKIARAKIAPCDITEVTLEVQKLNLSKPTTLDRYRDQFSNFFDVDTFRELSNLRSHISRSDSSFVSNYIEALSLGLLHGHSASYFSTYTYPQIAIAPREQLDLNIKRGQFPDYRSVAPRILKRAALVTSDGVPSSLRLRPSPHKVVHGDPRDLSGVDTGSVSLTVTSLPYPGMRDLGPEQWLKVWFTDLESRRSAHFNFETIDIWADFINEVLLELARVTKSGGRAVIDSRTFGFNGSNYLLDQAVITLIEESLERFWTPEVTLVQEAESFTSIGTQKGPNRQSRDYRVLVLRRK
jgi:SAM-dependent methyltransferase